ncbi:MAG TPA: cytochrome C oxidase subunit IV family protein [Longimicrobiales bacterium]|nr:cytochrome C oxidase subunit IV family protein [Longimicrobiales bacterium]
MNPANVVSESSHRKPNYMAVFFGLAVLTVIEVGIAFVGLGRVTTIIVLVGLAIWKAVLVALYYMHLRYEPPRLVLMVIAPLPLALILVLAVLTEF